MHIICQESIETVKPISGYTLDGKSAVDTYKCPGILVNYLGLKHMHAEVFSSCMQTGMTSEGGGCRREKAQADVLGKGRK